VATELFVDTSGWFPLADAKDRAHAGVARSLRDAVKNGRRIVTTNLVIAETHALIMRRIHRDAALAFLREVRRAPHLVVESTGEYELNAQRGWLERHDDQDFSLTDAVSFAVMTERGIREVLGIDRRFAGAGFAMLPATR